MQIVVDISEKDFKCLENGIFISLGRGICKSLLSRTMNAIINGTPLPKGHGRLIDADELKKHKYYDNDRHENAVSVAQIDWQPAIVEANKAESKDKG